MENKSPSYILNKIQYKLNSKNINIKNSVLNLLNISENITGGFSIDEKLVEMIGSIIYSKKYIIKDKQLDVDKHFKQSDLNKMSIFGNINLLNLLNHDLNHDLNESVEIDSDYKQKIKNRINFFCFENLIDETFHGIDIDMLLQKIDSPQQHIKEEIHDDDDEISDNDEEISDNNDDEIYDDDEL